MVPRPARWPGWPCQSARPTRVLVGGADELFIAERYAPLLEAQQPLLRVTLLPGVSHIGLVADPPALAALVAAL